MIEFQCPICTRVLKIAPEHAGEEGACSYCGGRIVVPTDVLSSEGTASDFAPNVSTGRYDGEIAKLYDHVDSLKATVRALQTQLDQSRDHVQELTGKLEQVSANIRTAGTETQAQLSEIQSQLLHLNEQVVTPVAVPPTDSDRTAETPASCPLCTRLPYLMMLLALAAVVLAVVFFVDHPVTETIRNTVESFFSRMTQR